MARRAALIAKKVKKPRVSHSEAYLINRKYMGDEPEFLGAMTDGEYGLALNWYNTMCDTKDAREYIQEYLIKNGRKADAKKLNRLNDGWISTTAGWICRMHNKGYMLPDSSNIFLKEKLQDMLSRVTVEEPKEETQKVSIQARMRERAQDIIGEIEELIDAGEEFSMYEWLKVKQIPATYSPIISAYYAKPLTELIEAYEGKDPQLKEAYRHMPKKLLADRIKFFHMIVTDAEKYAGVVKKTRAPRKPRAVSVEKKLKNVKFQKEDNTYKIASINPEKVLGCQELWTFNTKNKVLTVLRAIDRGGLQIKGTSIINYDEANSFSKRTGRKSNEYVKKVQEGSKITLRKLMPEIKSSAPLAFRLNENTILLKIT